jgi:hypothetical protein
MKRRIMPRHIAVMPLPAKWNVDDHDLFICVAGYERRARYIAETLTPRANKKICIGFDKQKVHSFHSNVEWFESNQFSLEVVGDDGFSALVGTVIRAAHAGTQFSLIVDISSISRFRLGCLVNILFSEVPDAVVRVDFVYALAAYNPPIPNAVANSHVGPVNSSFAGWWTEPDRAVSAVVGLGYEEDKALGAVEYLQAADVWAFIPTSVVQEYSSALQEANEILLRTIPSERQMSYRVNDPADCFKTLESLVYGLSISRNPILLPFGPKLFALCCLLVGIAQPNVAVWRVSAQAMEPAVDRVAEGPVYGLRVLF